MKELIGSLKKATSRDMIREVYQRYMGNQYLEFYDKMGVDVGLFDMSELHEIIMHVNYYCHSVSAELPP